MTYFPLRACITTYVLGVVWSSGWPGGDSYISSRVSRQIIHLDCFSFSLLYRIRFFLHL
jgi:hypothetical protein